MSDQVINPWDVQTSGGVVREIKVPFSLFLQFYTRSIYFETDKVYFERVNENYRRVAPFVAPNVQGFINRRHGYTADALAPAYVKEKDEIDINAPLMRMPGETLISGSLSNQQRHDIIVADMAAQQKQRIYNRFEWLACKAAKEGEVTISGEKYPTRLVNFNRNPGLTLVTDWSTAAANADPMADISSLRRLANSESGARIVDVYFGRDAYNAYFRVHKEELVGLGGLMDTRLGGSDTQITRMMDQFEGLEYVGRVSGLNGAGEIRIWVYEATFLTAEENAQEYFLEPDEVFGISPTVFAGVRCFGAIKDGRAGWKAMEIFAKNWVSQEDPWEEFFMTQSAPLMVPGNANATFLIKTNTSS